MPTKSTEVFADAIGFAASPRNAVQELLSPSNQHKFRVSIFRIESYGSANERYLNKILGGISSFFANPIALVR
jgi:hypothetical protein